jgi:hypothetical protein
MPLVTPDGVQAEGNVKVAFKATLTNAAAPTAAECTAAIDLTGYIKGGTFTPTAEQSTGDDRRLSSRETYQVLGRVTRGFDDVQYVFDPQNTTPSENQAYTTLTEGTTGYIIVRWGIAATTAFAATQKVDVIPIECGAQRKVGPAENDEFARLVIQQKWGVTGPANVDVAIAA